MSGDSKKKKMSLGTLIGVTIAFFGAVRTVPELADTGWNMFIYMLIAGIGFALPVALISAELSTAFSSESGTEHWVAIAFNNKVGFISSWLLWVQMFFGMAMVGSTVAALLGYTINIRDLGEHPMTVFIILLVVYWALTILNIKFDMTPLQGSYGAVIGIYLPFAVVIGFGIYLFATRGINPEGFMAGFTGKSLLPDLSDINSLPILTGIVFIFAGVEMSSVHANDVENPGKNYPVGAITAVILVMVLNLVAAFGMANAVHPGDLELSNIMASIAIMVKDLSLPAWFDNVLALCILIGTLVTMSSWVLGPSKAMLLVAKQGNMPPLFQKTNERGVPVAMVITQAAAVSVIGLLFVLIPDVDSVFLILNVTTMVLYCIVYILLILSAVRLRKLRPDAPRTFRVGRKGNALLYILGAFSLIVVTGTIIIGMIKPSGLGMSGAAYLGLQLGIVVVIIAAGLIITACRKPEWNLSENNNTENTAGRK